MKHREIATASQETETQRGSPKKVQSQEEYARFISLVNESFPNMDVQETPQEIEDINMAIFTIEEKGNCIAGGKAKRSFYNPTVVELSHLCVAQGRRQEGFAGKITQARIDWARAQEGVNSIETDPSWKNIRSVKDKLSHGFVITDIFATRLLMKHKPEAIDPQQYDFKKIPWHRGTIETKISEEGWEGYHLEKMGTGTKKTRLKDYTLHVRKKK